MNKSFNRGKEEVGGGVFEKFVGGEEFRFVVISHWPRCGSFLLANQESSFLHLVIFVPLCQEGSFWLFCPTVERKCTGGKLFRPHLSKK